MGQHRARDEGQDSVHVTTTTNPSPASAFTRDLLVPSGICSSFQGTRKAADCVPRSNCCWSGEIWKVREGFPFTCSLESTCLSQDVQDLAAKKLCLPLLRALQLCLLRGLPAPLRVPGPLAHSPGRQDISVPLESHWQDGTLASHPAAMRERKVPGRHAATRDRGRGREGEPMGSDPKFSSCLCACASNFQSSAVLPGNLLRQAESGPVQQGRAVRVTGP